MRFIVGTALSRLHLDDMFVGGSRKPCWIPKDGEVVALLFWL